jgi:glycosyltransferase involved in cell wall biosynthesis
LNQKAEEEMKNPKVSVVIPAYNHERYVGEAIRSVLGQTRGDFELILINDGSTDQTEAEILKFKDNRIRYYSQENRGLSATLNRGIELARGEYFNFLPSDDAFFPEKLAIQLHAFEESGDIGVVFSYHLVIDGEGKAVRDDPIVDWFNVPFETKEEIFPALFERNFLSAPTALVKMACFQKVGLFDESLKTAQDYDMWMRILKYYDLRLIKQPLLRLRWHGANLTYRATTETESERTRVLLKAYKSLSIEDIFPSLRQKSDRMAYGQACETLATSLEKSGIPALVPISQIYRDQGNSLLKSNLDPAEPMERELREMFEVRPSGRGHGKINLLIEVPSLDKGGMEEVVYHIAIRLNPDLFHPVLVCVEKGGYTADRLKRGGIPVEILGKAKEKEYLEILRRYQIDLVNSHFSFFGLPFAHRLGIPTISVLHSIYTWYSGGVLDEFRAADPFVSKYVAVSKQVASFFRYRFNIDRGRMRVIPDGISLERFSKERGQEKPNLSALGIDEDDFVFLHVGAVSPAKMHNLLIAAMKEVTRIHPKIKLISIGPGLNKEYDRFIRGRIEEHRLGRNLVLMDFVEDLSPYYRMANAFLLPSLIEGWGIVTLEAMYHGLPLILTKVGGAEELVEDGDIGILLENCCENLFQLDGPDLDHYSHLDFPKNAPELIDAMLDLYRNRETWKEKAKEGREKVLSRYNWDQIVPRYEKEFIILALGKEKEKSFRLGATVRDQEERLNEKEKRLNELKEQTRELGKKLDEQTREAGQRLISMSSEFQQRFDAMSHQLDYVLLRLSLKERIRERAHKTLKTLHRLVPKRLREKYRLKYREFFFERVFPDKDRFEVQDTSTPKIPNISAVEDLQRFLDSALQNDSQSLFLVYTTDPYLEDRGQRSTWLTREFVKKGFPVVFFYWRWNPKEAIVQSEDPLVFSIPIDEFPKVERRLFSSSLDRLKRVFLIEFPDRFLFEKVNLANANSYVTIYECVDDWEEFAKAGQALWYDKAVERHLVRNANLVMATNQRLAEKLKEMGASNVPIIPNGVDLNSFKPGAGKISLQRGALTVGYFGHLTESWFDWNLLTKMAQARKDWVFHIIGYGEPSGLKLPENVHFWGRVEHRDLPAYTRFWDVAMIPFREGRLTEAVDPIKLYEYLFLSLPVVATNMFHLRGTPGVFVCLRDDFERTLILAKQTPFPRQEVEKFIQSNTWRKRADQLLEEIGRVDLSGDILKSIR